MTPIWQNFRLFIGLTLLTGILYPLLITAVAQLTMTYQANGSFLVTDNTRLGSQLIGQNFTADNYFWPRPSASNYDALQSGGSNLGPTSVVLKKAIENRKGHILKFQAAKGTEIPSELLYASGSGLDPHISWNTALFQMERILKSRDWTSSEQRTQLTKLLNEQKISPFLGFGEPYVNVLETNLKLEVLLR